MGIKQALLVGINQYGKDSGLAPLRYAEDDARALAEALRRDCGFETQTLLGAAATGIEIQRRIQALSGGELFLFFFAGHGQMVRGQFCLHTAESLASGVGALSYEGLSRWWRYNFGFGQVLAVLDACRNEYNWGSRGARGFAASRDIESSMAGESLVEVLYGCSDGEVSYEEEELGHGVFTSALLRVLRDDAGEVDSGTLAARANDLIAEWCRKSGKRQKAKRYYEPSEKNRIVLRSGAVEAAPKQREETRRPEQADVGKKRGRFDVVRFILGLLLLLVGGLLLVGAYAAVDVNKSVAGMVCVGVGVFFVVKGCKYIRLSFKSP